MKTWTPKAELYDFGRPFPPDKVVELFAHYSSKPGSAINPVRVFEPGCGTGRILLPLAQFFPSWDFIGMDSSAGCLEVLKKRASEAGLSNIRTIEGSIEDVIPGNSYDLIIHSSLLHVIVNWHTVLKNLCAKLAPNGTLCLIGDYGDIYSEALGRQESSDIDPNLANFWRHYIQLRTDLGAPSPESSQIGTRWDFESTEIATWLEQNNFYESSKTEVFWKESFSRNSLLKIVEERCYSSMFTLDKEMIKSIVDGLRASVCTTGIDDIAISKHKAVCRFYKHTQS